MASPNTGHKKQNKIKSYAIYKQSKVISATTISAKGNVRTVYYHFTIDGFFSSNSSDFINETPEFFYSIEDLLSGLSNHPDPLMLSHFIKQYI